MARNDWYEAGEAIRNLVQDAVENQDFTQLSSTITNIVNQTVDGFQDALRESLRGRPQSGREGDEERFAKGAEFSGQEAAERIRRNMEAKKQGIRPPARNLRAPGRAAGWFLAAVGFGFGSMFGLALVILAAVGDTAGGIPDLVYEILGIFTGLNLWMGIVGGRRLGLANRFRRYAAMLGNRTYCTIEEFASGTGKTVSYIRKDLKEMLRRGFFPEGHLDRKETCLITDNETYQQYLAAQQEADRRAVFGEESGWSAGNSGYGNTGADGGLNSGKSRERSDRAENGRDSGQTGGGQGAKDWQTEGNRTSQESLNQECVRLIDEGRRYIEHIRKCNDRIPGEEISAKLDRLELVVTRIFREVERRPELAPELRKMMSYYLPTTQKLIDAYCQFDEQPIRGQNIDSTKKEIENALDTINQAFENLLDGFFENTAWDISSDISVLHTMFAQEGLTGKDFQKGGK